MDIDLGSLLFSFQGRINRGKYWLAVLVYFVIMIILILAGFAIGFSVRSGGGIVIGLLAIIFYIAIIISSLAVGIKRLHDRDKSGWWLLIFYFLPALLSGTGTAMEIGTGSRGASGLFSLVSFGISIWGFVELGCLRGTVGPNDYGPDPLGAG